MAGCLGLLLAVADGGDLVAVCAAAAAYYVVPKWYAGDETAITADPNAGYQAAATWVATHLTHPGNKRIVVDDGLATGASMIAALHAVRAKAPRELICAVPVAAPDSLERVKPYADKLVCLAAPPEFYAVGQFYREFPQIEDEDVVRLLAQAPHHAAGNQPA